MDSRDSVSYNVKFKVQFESRPFIYGLLKDYVCTLDYCILFTGKIQCVVNSHDAERI